MDVDFWPPHASAYLNTQEHRNKRARAHTYAHTHTQFSRSMGEQVTETFISSLLVAISGFRYISGWRSGSNTCATRQYSGQVSSVASNYRVMSGTL